MTADGKKKPKPADGPFLFVEVITMKSYEFKGIDDEGNPFEIYRQTWDDFTDKEKRKYSQFLINKSFSQHGDTATLVSKVNATVGLSDKHHFEFLYHVIPGGKRWGAKWAKPLDDDLIEAIADLHQLSIRDATTYYNLLTPDGQKQIKELVDKGGRK